MNFLVSTKMLNISHLALIRFKFSTKNGLENIEKATLYSKKGNLGSSLDCWGDQFRRTFAQIGDLRSLLPNEVKLLALTATATMDTYSVVKTRLGMVEPVLISMPPEWQNIFTM